MKKIEIKKLVLELEKRYGKPQRQPRKDPVLSLIKVILSQNTNDRNRDRAFKGIIQKYETTEKILNAKQEELAKIISVAGMQNIKSKRIKECLKEIKNRRGKLDLDFLSELDTEKAKEWLTELPGIGPKSAAIILNFDFKKPVFPVDTHVFRVTKRLGLIPQEVTRKKAHQLLDKITENIDVYSLHLNIIRHGRTICKSRKPRCKECFLNKYCNYYNQMY